MQMHLCYSHVHQTCTAEAMGRSQMQAIAAAENVKNLSQILQAASKDACHFVVSR